MSGEDSESLAAVFSGSTDSILDAYPDGAVVIDAELRVLSANAGGAVLAEALAAGPGPALGALIERAVVGRESASETVKLADGSDKDVAALPVGDNLAVLLLGREQSLERNLISTLIESRQRYHDLVMVSSDFAWEIGPEGAFIFVSPRGALDYSADDLIGRDPRDFIIDAPGAAGQSGADGQSERAAATGSNLPFLCDRKMENVEIWMRRADGDAACLLAASLPLIAGDGTWRGARGVCRDVTKERRNDLALARARDREAVINELVTIIRDEVDPLEALATAARVAAQAVGTAGCRIYRYSGGQSGQGALELAAAFGEEQGGPTDDDIRPAVVAVDAPLPLSGEGWSALASAICHRENVNGLICLWDPSGAANWSDDDMALVEAFSIQLGIAIEQMMHHERIVRLSRTDELTGLLNRRAFFDEELPRRVQRLKISAKKGALFYLDLDNFKRVNDVFGHQRGDEVLMFLSEFLVNHSRPGDAVSRFGGDEFGIWVDDIDLETATNLATRIIEESVVLRQYSGDDDHPLGISLGLAIFDPGHDESLNDLHARADAAMYEAKNAGRHRFVVAPEAKNKD